MKITHIFISVIFISPVLLAEEIKIEKLSQDQIYENWLVSRCIGKSTDSEKTKQDAFRSAAAYLEFSKLPIDAFEQGEKLAEQYAKKDTQGSVKGSYHTLECLSLQNANEAKAIFERYSKE
ncbi:T6SS amidase immunity protein Tai4 family protein [Serratia entomophila]|uniref:Uncharacterized protein n=1 Tax=Serratia entomophila TaxID=42906 RepID=A0ABY5CM91_9GAMM|nr:T6SS amidase immunity protein Tai4 family protein [Serratia entomophila]USU99261.1 hypothetical protein KFQ06_14445 [Serratia entomophila]CAI0724776.1 Uncharacterised protein [Serratia entomophila]CAI0728728.1 Uncharacterised protein [Serratia entomophila]CAI0730268.1 Uncharacterised protein [Serratia entomophila]CAI0732008.1 Uncharacterised protein [Serratia entomophila]